MGRAAGEGGGLVQLRCQPRPLSAWCMSVEVESGVARENRRVREELGPSLGVAPPYAVSAHVR